ncbi:MAG: MFS transporter [Candidatus Thermoplasmatota archaeon]|nr:MFS transporter [Candidatus Thermoplasmatota archaeon]
MRKPKQKTVALAFISLAWLIIFVGRLTGPTLLVQIEKSLNITDPQAGVALSAMWFLYGIMQFPGGALSDSFGRKKVILLSILSFALANILIGLSFNYLVMLVTFSLLGMAAGLFPSPSLTMLSELFKEKKGKALGIRSGVGSLSGLVPMVLPLLALMIGWRNIFLLWAVVSFVILYLFYIFVEETLKEPKKRAALPQLKMGLKSLAEKETSFMFIINLMISFSWIGMISWFPTYIQKAKGFGPETAGVLFSIVLLGGFLLKPILGTLSDKVNKLYLILFLITTASISLYFLTITSSFFGLVIIALVFSQTGAFYPIRTSYLMDRWYSKNAGTKLGVFRSGIILLASPISAVIGWTKSIYGFDLAIILVVGCLILAAFMLIGKLLFTK